MTVEPLPPQDGVRVLRAAGEVDVLTTQPLQDRVAGLADDEPLVLDLTDVTFLDSAGVRLLDRVARVQADRGGFCVVAPPGGRPRRVLDLVGFSDRLLADDLGQGVERVRR